MSNTGNYSLRIGLWKTIKNNGLIVWIPAILAFLANVPIEYAPIASFLIYLIKNYIQNK